MLVLNVSTSGHNVCLYIKSTGIKRYITLDKFFYTHEYQKIKYLQPLFFIFSTVVCSTMVSKQYKCLNWYIKTGTKKLSIYYS